MSNLPGRMTSLTSRTKSTSDTFAHDLYEELAPLAIEDKENGFALARYCASIGIMIQDIIDLSRAPSAIGPILSIPICARPRR